MKTLTLVLAILVGAVFGLLPTDAEADGFPIHGHYCGPGHGGGEPDDALDEACKRHDECYERRGYSDCECDAQLLDAIDELPSGGPPQASLIRSWFTDVQPCQKGSLPVPPGINNAVRNAETLLDGELDNKDLEAGIEIVTTPFVPGASEVGRTIRKVAGKVFRKLW